MEFYKVAHMVDTKDIGRRMSDMGRVLTHGEMGIHSQGNTRLENEAELVYMHGQAEQHVMQHGSKVNLQERWTTPRQKGLNTKK